MINIEIEAERKRMNPVLSKQRIWCSNIIKIELTDRGTILVTYFDIDTEIETVECKKIHTIIRHHSKLLVDVFSFQYE